MELEEIKEAVDAGKTVCWISDGYEVEQWKTGLQIVCKSNSHAIGLTWEDGKTMNGNAEDFYIKESDV